jgi:hypothetical protein
MPLFKQLRPEEIKPLLDKAKRGEKLGKEERELLDGTLIDPWHRKARSLHTLEKTLKRLHEDSLVEERLPELLRIRARNSRKDSLLQLHEKIERISDAIMLLGDRRHFATDTLKVKHGLSIFDRLPEQAVSELREFARVREVEALAKTRDDLHNMLVQKARKADVKEFFARIAAAHSPENRLLTHSNLLDSILGIRYDERAEDKSMDKLREEKALSTHPEVGKVVMGFYAQAPYEALHRALRELGPGPEDVFYDLGSGHGRVTLFTALTTPVRKVVGVEMIPHRLAVGKAAAEKYGIGNAEFRLEDVNKSDFSDGTVFFLYNPFTPETLQNVLEKLKEIKHPFRIIGMGASNYKLDEVPWLERKVFEGFTIYEKKQPGKSSSATR